MKTTNKNCKKKSCKQCEHIRLNLYDGFCVKTNRVVSTNEQSCKQFKEKK